MYNVKTGRCNKIPSLKTKKKSSNKCDNNKMKNVKKLIKYVMLKR